MSHRVWQTTPSHIIGQLDKCIREASTLDGVLEFRHEHFWTVAFGMMVSSFLYIISLKKDTETVQVTPLRTLASSP